LRIKRYAQYLTVQFHNKAKKETLLLVGKEMLMEKCSLCTIYWLNKIFSVLVLCENLCTLYLWMWIVMIIDLRAHSTHEIWVFFLRFRSKTLFRANFQNSPKNLRIPIRPSKSQNLCF
jgi:hypothetical protein